MLMADRVGQHIDDYRLIRLRGTGSFGQVYLGEHPKSQLQTLKLYVGANLARGLIFASLNGITCKDASNMTILGFEGINPFKLLAEDSFGRVGMHSIFAR